MNSKQRVEAAFLKQRTDRVPVNHRGFSGRISKLILGRDAFTGGSIQRWSEAKSLFEGWHDEFVERAFQDAWDIAKITHQDLVRVMYWGHGKKPTRKLDDNTFLFEYGLEDDWEMMRFFPDTEETVVTPYKPRQLTFEDLRKKVESLEKFALSYNPDERLYAVAARSLNMHGNDYAVEAGGVGIGIPQENIDVWLQAMVLEPDLVHRVIACQAEIGCKNIAVAAGLGLKYLAGGLDFCAENGPIYSPKMFAEFVLPGLKKLCDACHHNGAHYMFASDGNLWLVADYVFGKSGVDAFFEIDRKAGMDLARLRREYPSLTLLGNISSWTLSCGTKKDVEEEARCCCQAAKEYGGVIVGVSNAIQPETPDENVFAMLEAIEKWR